jgi:hypothetical protein
MIRLRHLQWECFLFVEEIHPQMIGVYGSLLVYPDEMPGGAFFVSVMP